MHKGKDKSCGCQHDAPYGGRPRMPLTFGDGGFVSKALTDDIDALVAEHYKGDKKLAARAKAMLKQLAFGGLTDKTSGSIEVGVDPDAGKSTAAFDLGTVESQAVAREVAKREGTLGEELKDAGRYLVGTSTAAGAGIIDTAANMAGMDIDLSSSVRGMKLGELNEREVRRRERAEGVASAAGALAATIVGGVVTGGNPYVISKGAEQTFTEVGEIDPENEALQKIAEVGEAGAGIYGGIAGGGLGSNSLGGFSADQLTEGAGMLSPEQTQQLGSFLSTVSAAGGYIQMPHGGPDSEHGTVQPPEGGTQFLLDYLGQFGGKEGESFGDIRDYARSRIDAKASALATEQADVERVRSEVLNQAQKIADGWANLSPESREYYDKLKNLSREAGAEVGSYDGKGISVVAELKEMQKNMPAELRAILPEEGYYNVHLMDPSAITTHRDLYCTPMGCLPYDQLLGGDMLTRAETFRYAASNPRFVEGVKAGVIPFELIDPSQRQPGDIELQVKPEVIEYSRPDLGYTNRPHHTRIYTRDVEDVEMVPGKDYYDDEGRLVGGRGSDKMYPSSTYGFEARVGDEERFGEYKYPLEYRKDYYRYVGNTPALQQALTEEETFLDQLFQSQMGQELLSAQQPNIEKIQPQPISSYQTPTQLPIQTGSSILDQVPKEEKKGLFKGRKKDEGGSIDYKKGGSYQGGLRRWFKEKWVDVKTGKPCGRSGKEKSKRGYPYCRPSRRVSSKTPATSKHSAAKSRAAQKTGPKRVKPIMCKRSKK